METMKANPYHTEKDITDTKDPLIVDVEGKCDTSDINDELIDSKDMTALESNDIVLTRKIYLINNALDEIGFTWYHVKLFIVAGFGYSADSQLVSCNAAALTYFNYQFGLGFSATVEVLYAGLLTGAFFWGLSADVVGRKLIFNSSLLLGSIFSFFTGGMGSLALYCIFLFLTCFTLGGNLAIDATVFLEYLPFKYQFLTTLFACWWSVGQTITALTEWAFIPKYHCESRDNCPSFKNRGWRYVWYVNAAIVLVFALCRIFVLKLDESPKFLVSNGRDAEAVQVLQRIAKENNRNCSLTLEKLQACGEIHMTTDFHNKKTVKEYLLKAKQNVLMLFSNKKMTINTLTLFLSWFGIGITYPLYSNFLPTYLATRGANISASTTGGVYRDAVISTAVSFAGPIIGGFLILIPRVGRRGTLAIGGVVSMAFLFGYTSVRNRAGNIGFACASYLAIYIYYGCLYGYTPEVLPSSCRASGASLSLLMNRFASLLVPVIAYYSDTSSSVPIWICGACVGIIGLAALFFPFEPSNQRSV